MATKLPYFRWYPADTETDEWFKSLTDSEVGYYLRLMNHAWINGSIPADSTVRCRVFKVHPKTDQAAFKKLARKFQEDPKEASRLVHEDLQEQLKEILRKSASAAESVKRRYKRTTTDTVSVGSRASESDSDSVFGSKGGSGGKPKRLARRTSEQIAESLGERLPWWEKCWAIYPEKNGKRPAMETFARVVTTRERAVEVYRGIERYNAKVRADPTIKIKYFQGWLTDERWNDADGIPRSAPESETLADRTIALVQEQESQKENGHYEFREDRKDAKRAAGAKVFPE